MLLVVAEENGRLSTLMRECLGETCLSTGLIPTTGFQGRLRRRLKASPPTRLRLEWTTCSTSTGH